MKTSHQTRAKTAIIIGNSDGIGLNLTRRLLKSDWEITGISRSPSAITHPEYTHIVCDVHTDEYMQQLAIVIEKTGDIDLCVYCAAIGEMIDFSSMAGELIIMDINLQAVIRTISLGIPAMISRHHGQFIGLSSVADALISAEAPAYHASKAGMSSYLEGLALATRSEGVSITNIRFGFVDTKMAKGDIRPFMMTVDKATAHILRCINKKPVRYTAPKIVIPMVKFRDFMLRRKF